MVSKIGRAAMLAAATWAITACGGAPTPGVNDGKQETRTWAGKPPPVPEPSASASLTRSGVSAGANRASSRRFTLTSTTGQVSMVEAGVGVEQRFEPAPDVQGGER